MATSVTEEMVFSGFIAKYLEKYKMNMANIISLVGLLAAVIRLPILIFVFHLSGMSIFWPLLLSGMVAIINSWVRLATNNVMGSIVSRMLMGFSVFFN